jgi:hypothetical protein
VDPGNSANVVTASVPMVLADISPASGPQVVQVTVPPKGSLPATVNIVLVINGVSAISPQQFTFV